MTLKHHGMYQDTSPDLAAALAHIRSVLHELWSRSLNKFFQEVTSPAFRDDPKASDLYLRYDAANAAHRFEKTLTRAAFQAMDDLFRPVLDKGQQSAAGDSFDVELINFDEYDLAEITQAALRFMLTAPAQYLPVQARLANILTDLDLDPQCLRPQQILDCGCRQINTLALNTQGKALLGEVFAKALDGELGAFYAQLNRLLTGFDHNAEDATGHVTQPPQGHAVLRARLLRSANPLCRATRDAPSPKALSEVEDEEFVRFLLWPAFSGDGELSQHKTMQLIAGLAVVQWEDATREIPMDAEDIKRALKWQLYAGGTNGASDLVEQHAYILDNVGGIFQGIQNAESLSPIAKALLMSLQIPVMRFAVLDFPAFQSAGHPVRRLLGELLHWSADLVREQAPMFEAFKSIVIELLQNCATDPLAFQLALDRIIALTPAVTRPPSISVPMAMPALAAQDNPRVAHSLPAVTADQDIAYDRSNGHLKFEPLTIGQPRIGQSQAGTKIMQDDDWTLLMVSLPGELKPGTWFEIYQGEDKARRRLKFLKLIEGTRQAVFTNRLGRVGLTVDLRVLLSDLTAGRTQPITDTGLFDRALSLVIGNIRDQQKSSAHFD